MIFEKESIEKRREVIVEMLQRSVCDITFTKVNGEVRCMPCTLREDIKPAINIKEDKPQKKKSNAETMSVWCTDKQEWRSFRLANVKEIIPSE